jgi:hypothetical protein
VNNKPMPIALAMIICDTVIEDKLTNKKTLIGVFNRVNSPKAPCIHPCVNVFLSLTEGIGEYDCTLKCIEVSTEKSILDLKGKINFTDRKEIAELNFELRGIMFPNFGEYRFEFYSNNEPLISRRFLVHESR